MYLVPPTEDQIKICLKEISLTKEDHKKASQDLKNWLLSQPHLPHDIEDTILDTFIIGCKNSLERSKQTLDKYLTNRTSCPEFYSDRDPLDPFSRKQARLFQFFTLPRMTPEGYRVSIYRLSSPDISTADFTLRMNGIHVLSTFDVRFQEDPYSAGEVLLLDCQNVGFRHIQALTSVPLLKKYVYCSHESVPVRTKKIIFFNLSPVIEPLLTILKMVMKDKLVKRITTTTDNHMFLHKHVPKDILPNEYGGEAGTLNDVNDAWWQKVESYRDWFLKDMNRKVDESKRPEDSKKFTDDFGAVGSFRTLSID